MRIYLENKVYILLKTYTTYLWKHFLWKLALELRDKMLFDLRSYKIAADFKSENRNDID